MDRLRSGFGWRVAGDKSGDLAASEIFPQRQ
jgi:hypothetical protein